MERRESGSRTGVAEEVQSIYVRAKHYQVVEKDHKAAILWFWKAINEGDRVDSALKDMAVVMKQTDRAEEAIEAIKSFRHLCSKQAQESLDNLLIDLYKKCGRFDEQIHLYKQKLRAIYQGEAFNGKSTKTARSHGKKFRVSIDHETARILGNLGWIYMQQKNYDAAEVVYRNAQQVKPEANMACNLARCLMKKGRFDEAFHALDDVMKCRFSMRLEPDERGKSMNRAEGLMRELEEMRKENYEISIERDMVEMLDFVMESPFVKRRLPIFEEIYSFNDQMGR